MMSEARFFKTSYDRSACKIGVIHIGYGAFHRAHQAVYIDDYMQTTGDLRWGIAAVNLRPSESESFEEAAKARDGYLLKTIAPDGTLEFRTVRSHLAHVDAAVDIEAALGLFAQPDVSIASLTVTESGYAFDDHWDLNLTDPAVAADLADGSHHTIYGFLAAGLKRRRETIGAPLTIMCCDNIRKNGQVLRKALMSFLHASGQQDLCAWVEKFATFPSSMVDRITPRSTPDLRAEVSGLFPMLSATAIHAEDVTQWVLEDHFANDVPDLTQAGVQVVQDVEPYEEAKIRILNGGHTGLTYLGALAGHQTFDQAMHDPALRAHFDAWETSEVLVGLGQTSPFDTSAYLAKVSSRFENSGIADQLERICMDGYSKMAIYIRPTIRALLERGITPAHGYNCIASWIVYARKSRNPTFPVPYHEPLWDKLEPMLDVGQESRIANDAQLWGDIPQRFASFVPDLVSAIKEMEAKWQD